MLMLSLRVSKFPVVSVMTSFLILRTQPFLKADYARFWEIPTFPGLIHIFFYLKRTLENHGLWNENSDVKYHPRLSQLVKQKYLKEDSYPSKKYSSLNSVRWILFCFVQSTIQIWCFEVMPIGLCSLWAVSKKSSLGVKYIKSLTI